MNWLLYGVTFLLLIISWSKDKKKTGKALKKAWKAFEHILPQFLVIIMIVGLLIALLNPELISRMLGTSSGFTGVIIAALVGSITLIPGFIAFPTASLLLAHGAGYMQIGAFISSLMMVGVITFPLETTYFGKKITLMRNSLAFLFSLCVAYIIGVVVPIL